ncbi:response regulator [Paenibacillus sp. OAS669]|uniref:response regulator n=1 Tax=Paenibacillus sp. OAS669 TaxID=2663821 RepID=UPI00178BCD06|nr:response regulator [Paenibacillus sp. OAS669]MBE1446221.1 signal transduction histidine kinase/DNA-binding response OmpR family regulator [Paenibacillus sp. OAS669]
MKIKTKLFLGFGALMVLMFTLAGIGINRLTTIDESMKEIYSNRYKKVQLTAELHNGTTELAKSLANLLLIADPAKSTQSLEAIRSQSLIVSKALSQMDTEFKGGMEQSLAADISNSGKTFLKYKDDVLQLYRAGKQAEANELRTAVGVGYQDDFVSSIGSMTDYQEEAMKQALTAAEEENSRVYMYTMLLAILSLLIGIAIMFWIVLSVTRGLGMLSGIISNFGLEKEQGRWMGSYRIAITTTDEFADIAHIFNEIAEDLEESTANERKLSQLNADQAWLESHISFISTELQSVRRFEEMGQTFIGELCRIIGAHSGAIYIAEKEAGPKQDALRTLELKGMYARADGTEPVQQVIPGQGLIGQCALDGKPIDLTEVPADYLKIRSAFGEVAALSVAIRSAVSYDEVVAVFEVASLQPFSLLELQLLDRLSEIVAITVQRIRGQLRVEELLRISQSLTDELQSQSEELLTQQEELQASNEKLEEQTKALQASEELLQRQQEELERSNADLLRKTKQLEEQILESEEMNRQIEHANDALEKQAIELAYASKYKSEFLANMSHELRTPLNSLLILSQLLKENKEGNLNRKQVEYAETIYTSGSDLLKLIDDVLDLAKVESGKMELHTETVVIKDVTDALYKAFAPMARKKKLSFDIQIDEGTPQDIVTDSLRLQQVLKNLLSNAFKFTFKGGVSIHIHSLTGDSPMIGFTIADTGIGIPADKQRMIFEAFRQADGTTSRHYGGTGLGLSISRQIAGLLGGCIELESVEGEGSRFTLYVPQNHESLLSEGYTQAAAARDVEPFLAEPVPPMALLRPMESCAMPSEETQQFPDDRGSIEEGDRVLLIVEDDIHFAKICMDTARERGFKTIVALQGDTGLELAKAYKPDAILLDIQLPVIDGWSILVHLKNDAATRHIPVHIVSVVDEIQQGLSMGAIAYLQKPSSKESLEQAFTQIEAFLDNGLRRLLLVGKDEDHRSTITELIGHDDVQIVSASGGAEAWEELKKQSFDCMVIDMGPTDLAEFELLDRIKSEEGLRRLPIVIYTQHRWDSKERLRLKKYAESIIIKDVKSPERLLDETAMFLHRVEARLPEAKRRILQKLHSKEAVFAGKKVLLVDDDIRNVFALSNLLEGYDMQVSFAETGKQALERLSESPDIDLVLMDIMMPEMDGYEAMGAIRSQPQFEQLPIIALTAKAMKDDREKCVQAGASDYITKPVHTEQLLSLIRVWLCK